jgi:ATP-dependent Clp protease adaptor protein ClpS
VTKTITLPGSPKTRPEEQTRRMPMYNVVLLDDDHHTFDYVIAMLQQLFGYPREKGYQMALEVHTSGRCIVFTGTKEYAELKRDQIHAFGADPLSSKECQGSMTAVLEPAY